MSDTSEPLERDELPWLKDPNIKISIWAIIKDSIGKDISKLTVPVYMNDASSLLQKCGSSMEYIDILDKACAEKEQAMRLAIVSVFGCSMTTSAERSCSKPFNPLLGETFELTTDEFEFLSEQVSHHPPVCANYARGRKSNYIYWNNTKTNTKFNGKGMDLYHQYRTYVDLPDYKERYEIQTPSMSLHNLIVGTMYLDIGGTLKSKILDQPNLACQIRFQKKGWISREEYKCEGEVYETQPEKGKKGRMLYKIHGRWSSDIFITAFMPDQYAINGKLDESTTQCFFSKNPYPEKWAYMYGMSHFSLQLNYFPSWLQKTVAPTDSRRRPDQRALENGDMILAAKEKDRLENK